MDEQVLNARRQTSMDVEAYRKAFQQPHQRRDFDLSDPQSRLKDHPARQGDDDEACGASSGQKFSGEDLVAAARTKLQQEQMRIWTHVQLHEKVVRDLESSNEEQKYHDLQQAILDKMNVLDHAANHAKREKALLDQHYNLSMVNEYLIVGCRTKDP